MKKITVIIPCFNEAASINQVITNFPDKKMLQKHGYKLNILVIDNNSTDNTAEIALAAGAQVIHEPKQGKGNAIRTGFYNVSDDTDYVVMLDGDNTYQPHEILRLVEPLNSGFSDVIIGSRLGGKMHQNAMSATHRLANWLFSFMVRVVYRVNVTDVLTGYFAWNRSAIWQLRPHLQSRGFAIEMEMITKMARLGYQIYSVPISYEPRTGKSNLRPFYDGSRIFKAWSRQLHWHPNVERVAFVSDAIYPFNKGGKEKRLYEISRRLVKEGRMVHIYTMQWWSGPKHIIRDGVHLHAISRFRPLYEGDKRSISQAFWYGLACLKLISTKFDVVDVDHMPFLPLFSVRLVCWLRRTPMYGTWHEYWGRQYWQQYLGTYKGLMAAVLERIACRLPDTIVSNSTHTTKRLKEAGIKRPIVTVPLGVDIKAIFDAPVHPQKSDVIYTGRLLTHKNVDLLIQAIQIVKLKKPTIACLIIGDGPERTRLEDLVKTLDLQSNITFFNFLEDQTEVYGLMKASKVLVQPSTREGFGLVVVEANACGIPVITMDHDQNAASALIKDGVNGLLSNVTAQDLAHQITTVLHTGRLQASDAIKAEAAQYEWSDVTTKIEEVFKIGLS